MKHLCFCHHIICNIKIGNNIIKIHQIKRSKQGRNKPWVHVYVTVVKCYMVQKIFSITFEILYKTFILEGGKLLSPETVHTFLRVNIPI